MTIWALCEGAKRITPLSLAPWRIVEAQHVLSSRDIVDTVQEHDILEDLIESSKPSIVSDKNYLIYTPFRYPPLPYGSRFGKPVEPSLWYGSLQIETAFAEVAYYRKLFLNNTEAKLEYVEILLTAFQATLKTDKGVDLTIAPFYNHTKTLSHPESYEESQAFGSAMRVANIEAFVYFSARTSTKAKNVGAFTPNVFCKHRGQYVFNQQNWNCIANQSSVEFTRLGITGKSRFIFS